MPGRVRVFMLMIGLWVGHGAWPAGHAQLADSAGTPVTLAVAGRVNSTPWITARGRYVAVSWAATVSGASDIFVAVSADGGTSFGPPVQVNTVAGEARVNGEIPPRVALHAAAGVAAPQVVVAWNAKGAKDAAAAIKIARSQDGGRTFGAPVALQAAEAVGERGWHALALDEQGVAHVQWLDHRGLAGPKGEHTMPAGTEHDGVAMAQRSSLYYASYGVTAGPERALAPGVCYCCKSALVALPGGTLVSAWRHVFAGNMRDMAFTVSRDSGRSFAAPARVSEDGWSINGCPDDGPALAAGPDQRVHIVWPTVIPGDTPTGAIFYSTQTAAGGFAPRTRVPSLGSPKPSHPQVVVDPAGRIVVAWDESQGGMRTAAVVAGERQADGSLRFGTPERLATGATPTTYPVMAVSSRGVMVAWTSGAPGASVIQVRSLAAASAAPAPEMPHHGGQMTSGRPDHMDHRFDDPERYAKEFDDPGRDAWQMPERVIAALALAPGATVADVGAGFGYFSMRVAASAARPTVFAVQASATSPNLPTAVDVVLIVDTYHHIPNRTAYFTA